MDDVRYDIEEELASSGMAELLLARDPRNREPVVVKRLRRETAENDPRAVRMFVDEIRITASLNHPNIIGVRDMSASHNDDYIVMDYVDGKDLRKVMRQAEATRTVIPVAQVVSIIAAAAAGLHYVHTALGNDRAPLGIVHRDVSPANILIGFDGRTRIIDFGIAKATFTVEEPGLVKGKTSYMAPEQCRAEAVDQRADVFALGIVMYEMVTMQRLFKGKTERDTIASILNDAVVPPAARRGDVPTELDAIIMRALEKRPDQRWQSVEQLRDALVGFAVRAHLRTFEEATARYLKLLFATPVVPRRPSATNVEEITQTGEVPTA